MKKLIVLMTICTIAFMSCTRVPAGYIGLKINMLGDDKGGVTELPAGKYYNSPNVEYQMFPTFVQTYNWTEGCNPKLGSSDDEAVRFQTSEGMQFTCDIGIIFQIAKEAGVCKNLYLQYRRGVNEIIDGPLRNAVCKAFMTHGTEYTADQIIGTGKNKLIADVQNDIKAQFLPAGIEVQSLSWLSSPRPPKEMIQALNDKVQANQLASQKENEVRSAQADAQKAVAKAQGEADSILAIAKAQAKANELLSQSITPSLIEVKRIEKWNGVYPQVTGGSTITDLRIK